MRGELDYRFLAMSTGSTTSISSTYILFLTEMQKRQTHENEFALLINEYVENSVKEQRENLTELTNIVP